MNDNDNPNKPARIVGTGVAAAFGASVDGVPGAVLAAWATDAVVDLAMKSWDELANWRRSSVAAMVQFAADDLDTSPDDLLTEAQSEGGKALLLNDAMLAAGRTFYDVKVAALAKAVANGLRDDGARIDQERLMIAALADLEEPHIKMLLAFRHEDCETAVTTSRKAWTLSHRVGLDDSGVRHLLSMLEERGLLHIDVAWEETLARKTGRSKAEAAGPFAWKNRQWGVTDFGRECIKYLLSYTPSRADAGDLR